MHAKHVSAEKLRKRALKLRSKLHASVDISCDGHFTDAWRMSKPSDEHLQRRAGRCDLTTYSICTDRRWFRVSVASSFHKAVTLCPVMHEGGQSRALPIVTVAPNTAEQIQQTLWLTPGAADSSMQIFGENKEVLLELRFHGVPSADRYSMAPEDDEYWSCAEPCDDSQHHTAVHLQRMLALLHA